ncbi:DUF1499 domain-containing protein [Aureimonas mangrovi]|uniref:DUF1499 domain-containing protein n=1 Tax=Aureimonas mangrovi TaxID=2758041 RepID=UPI00163DBDC3|nr:DUF1499 domain-containing protein [Aureimonas mangrovi]
MSGHYIRKRARSAGWAWALATFALALLAVALIFFRLQILNLQAFSLVVVTVGGLVVVALLCALFAAAKAWFRGHRGGGRAVAALFLSCFLAVPFAVGMFLAIEYPNSAMAETDGMAAQLSPSAGLPIESTRVVLGRDFRATAAEVYGAARSAIDASGWEVEDIVAGSGPQPAEGDLGVAGTVVTAVPTLRDTLAAEGEQDPSAVQDSDQYVISAVAYAPILALPSDVTIRIVEEDGVSYVDVRSVSRDVPRDLGQNRRFIDAFLARLDAAMDLLRSGPVEE